MGTQMVQYGFSLPHRGLDYQHCLKEIPRLKQLINTRPGKSSNASNYQSVSISSVLSSYTSEDYLFLRPGIDLIH